MSDIDYNQQTVNADKWSEMSLLDLIDQRNKLYNRYDFFASQKKDTRAIIEGITRVDKIIADRS